jgi:hypothetical protein
VDAGWAPVRRVDLTSGNDSTTSASSRQMNADADSALDGLARFVQVIGRDDALRQRFGRLANLSPVQRANEIHIMAEQMTAERKDPELVALFSLFADARVFEAAMAALRECGYVKD